MENGIDNEKSTTGVALLEQENDIGKDLDQKQAGVHNSVAGVLGKYGEGVIDKGVYETLSLKQKEAVDYFISLQETLRLLGFSDGKPVVVSARAKKAGLDVKDLEALDISWRKLVDFVGSSVVKGEDFAPHKQALLRALSDKTLEGQFGLVLDLALDRGRILKGKNFPWLDPSGGSFEALKKIEQQRRLNTKGSFQVLFSTLMRQLLKKPNTIVHTPDDDNPNK